MKYGFYFRRLRAVAAAAACVACLAVLFRPEPAASLETIPRHAILVDVETGTVLLEHRADTPFPPASMSKLMTIYMAFERLADGSLSMDDEFLVSRKAWRMGGSKTFVRIDRPVTVGNLLRGIIVQSGNDACVVMAEGIAGSEEGFAEMMTRRGRALGLRDSIFRNATGWPQEGHVMTARDVAILSQRIIEDFPDYYPLFAEKTFTHSGIKQSNRNPLLYRDVGADGLKTGYTEASGYGLAASAIRDGRRVILVLAGLPSARARAQESLRLTELAFRRFRNYALFEKGAVVSTAGVWLGKRDVVPLTAGQDVKITLQRRARSKLKAVVAYTGPVPAPIRKGDPIARLVVTAPDFQALEVPLLAGETIDALGPLERIGPAIEYLLWGPSAAGG